MKAPKLKSYSVRQVKKAGITLEPIKCKHCGKVGEVVYNQYIRDASCQTCGKWDSEKKGRKK